MTALYNEIDPAACAVLERLIADGVIAPGVVDSRSITELEPHDVEGFTQVHLFAGGGLWSVAARLAGWSDDRPLWTASCPCQPFSAAGKGLGTDDPRHLWPHVHRLASAVRPPVLVGEQVAGKAGYGWFDGVSTSMEGEDYTCRAVDVPACAVDAPHQRNRLYWVAVAQPDSGAQPWRSLQRPTEGGSADPKRAHRQSGRPDGGSVLRDAARERRGKGRSKPGIRSGRSTAAGSDGSGSVLEHRIGAGLDGHAGHGDAGEEPGRDSAHAAGPATEADGGGLSRDAAGLVVQGQPSAGHQSQHREDEGVHARPNRTYWSDAVWIECHDGKARRGKPGIPLLVDGFPGRVDMWRIGGNAIVPPLAAEVLAALMEVME